MMGITAATLSTYAPGALADIGHIASGTNGLVGTGESATKLLPAALRDKIFPNMQKSLTRMADKAKTAAQAGEDALAVLSDATKGTEELSDATKVISAAEDVVRVVEVAGEALGPIGVVLDVAGNIAQGVIGVVEYAKIGDFDKDFNNEISKANQSVTASDLQTMDSTTLYSYLQAMTLTGGKTDSPTTLHY